MVSGIRAKDYAIFLVAMANRFEQVASMCAFEMACSVCHFLSAIESSGKHGVFVGCVELTHLLYLLTGDVFCPFVQHLAHFSSVGPFIGSKPSFRIVRVTSES